MAASLLKVDQLHVNVEQKEILHGVDLEINKGETHVLMGPNGAGKSTLGYALMGNPRYEVTDGAIYFNGKDITKETPAKRAGGWHFPFVPESDRGAGYHTWQFYPYGTGAADRKEDSFVGV